MLYHNKYNIKVLKSEKRDSNPQLLPWQGKTLPLSYFRNLKEKRFNNNIKSFFFNVCVCIIISIEGKF